MARTLDQIMQSLAPSYDQQTGLVKQQLDAIPGQEQATLAGLDQAKTNAFDQVRSDANARGVLYSGAPINEQQKYLGSTYLPALANVKAASQQDRYKLQSSLADIAQRRNAQAQDIHGGEVRTDQDNAYRQQQFQYEQQKQAQDMALRRQDMAFRQQIASQRAQRAAPDPAKGFRFISDDKGLNFTDAGGRPLTAAQYFTAKNGDFSSVVNALQSSRNSKDAAIAKEAQSGKLSPQQLAQKYPWVFGGV